MLFPDGWYTEYQRRLISTGGAQDQATSLVVSLPLPAIPKTTPTPAEREKPGEGVLDESLRVRIPKLAPAPLTPSTPGRTYTFKIPKKKASTDTKP